MGIRSMNRWQATGWHLLFSLILGVAVFLLFRMLWYPGALWNVAAAGKLLLIVLGVDIAIGPLLTMIVFDPKKRSLPFDLAVIVAVQLAALAYGIHVMAQSRPVYLVAAVDRFVLVTANDLSPEALAEASDPKFRELSWLGPVTIGAITGLPNTDKFDQVMDVLAGGADIDKLPKHYVDYAKVAPSIIGRSETLADLEKRNPKHVPEMRAWVATLGHPEDKVGLLLLSGRTGFATAAIDRLTGALLGTHRTDIFD